ncbi:class II aldolase/adducin family protein [Ruania suaedae]|uniref:class II aldolase/adducin family protein n=1 Tax=Ruania suaedae TaxID=2897774 RepID=UPI001E3EEF6E|nr:class II aldolase/adducin family protein [Ruania suaedae]UFU02880.1 class II aldolase/adducin family protein [Ruania suaedae]
MTDAPSLVEAGRRLVAAGLSPGTSGNLSARDGERILLSPSGIPLDELEASALSVVDLDGRHLRGPKPSKEVWLHRAMYRRDGATAVVVHTHSVHAVAASCLEPWDARTALPPYTPYLPMKLGQVPLVPYADPGDRAQAEAIEALSQPVRAVLLANHGPVVAGGTFAEAIAGAVEIEEAARVTMLLGGRGRVLEEHRLLGLAARYGTPWAASTG